jgi:hypothetical protein
LGQTANSLAQGLSYAELVRACEDVAKDTLLSGRSKLSGEDVLAAINERQGAHASIVTTEFLATVAGNRGNDRSMG